MKIKKLNRYEVIVFTVICMVLLSLILSLTLLSFSTSNNTALAIGEAQGARVGKVLSHATIEEDFDESSIIVVLDENIKSIGLNGNNFITQNIKNIKAVKDFTIARKETNESRNVKEKVQRTIKITLEEKGKQNVLNTIHALEKLDEVVLASPNYFYQPSSLNYNQILAQVLSDTTNEEDTEPSLNIYDNSWGLYGDNGIGATDAWGITTGSKNVRVGIMGDGIAAHDDLDANIVTGWDCIQDVEATYYSAYNNTGIGTYVAGIIGGTGQGQTNVKGISPNVSLIPLLITEPLIGAVYSEYVIKAVNWAAENDIDILYCSYSTKFEDEALLNALSNYNGLLVCAANYDEEGEGEETTVTLRYPGCYAEGQAFSDRVITVGGIQENGDVMAQSNYSSDTVSLFAPGSNIVSSFPSHKCTGVTRVVQSTTYYECELHNLLLGWVPSTTHYGTGYHIFSNVDVASSYAAGASALVWSKFLQSPYSMDRTEIARRVKATLVNNVTTDSRYSGKCASGGRLNLYKALSNISYKSVMNGFGYSSLLRYWRGEVNLMIDIEDSFFVNADDILVFNKSTDLKFSLGTERVYNTWHEIAGTVTYQLKNSNDEIVQISENDTFSSEFRVGLVSNVSYTNRFFTLNTGNLANDTYVLSLTCTATRDGNTQNSSASFTFKVNRACVAEGSLITLADGSQVAVENLTGNERLLVWNMLTGQFDTAPILFIDSESLSSYEVIKLTFSDGTEVRIIDEHAFFDMTLGEYVFLREDAARYIGHYFNKQSGDTWTTVQLTNVTVTVESTTAWSPVTYGHLCYYVNGMLTMPGATEGFINIFDVDTAQMKYDATAMANDIETYGLYTYEEFNALIPLPEFVFNAFNGQYLKVSVGKGLITLSEIADLLQRYSVFFN